MKQVAALVLDGVISYDLACVIQAFRYCPGPDDEPLAYHLEICGAQPGTVLSPDGLSLNVDHGLEALDGAEIVVVPGRIPGSLPDDVVMALRAAANRGATMVSICVGAFVLAQAGLLDGRPATTHWAFCDDLAQQFPSVRVDSGPLYIDDGNVLTSAGLSAGWDLCLHIVRSQFGAAVAAELARWNVRPPHREGTQAQYIPVPKRRSVNEGGLANTLAWASSDPSCELTVCDLARHAMMSERSFMRSFKDQVGTTPRRWLDIQRTARARELLETTSQSVESIAVLSGFGSVTSLRAHLRSSTGTTPTGYRRAMRR